MGVPAQRYEIECDETPVEVKASTNVALQRLDDCKGPFPGVNAETLRAQLKAKIVILESELRAEARAAAGLAIAE